MANIEQIQPKDTLKDTRVPINEMFKGLNQDIIQHKASTQAHDATAIKYDGKVVGAGNAKQAIDNVQEQVNTLVLNGDSSVAAKQAAIDANGHDYENLKLRLDTEHTQLSEQLAETAKRSELEQTNIALSQKANQSDLEYEASRINNLIANAGNTDGNAELLDIRIGFDGITYPTAGEATRALGNYMTDENQLWEV